MGKDTDLTSTSSILAWSNWAIDDLYEMRKHAERLKSALYRTHMDTDSNCYSEVNACQAVIQLTQALHTALWTVRYRALERNTDEKIG